MHILFSSSVSATLHMSPLDALVIGAAVYLLLLPFCRKKGLRQNLFYLAVLLYGSFLFCLTVPIVLVPYPESLPQKIRWAFFEIRRNPVCSVTDLSSAAAFVKSIGGNFCLLMPLALLCGMRHRGIFWKRMLDCYRKENCITP